MIIHVTQEDIDNGTQSDCRRCPVAWALKRAFETSLVAVEPAEIIIEKERWKTPGKVYDFVYLFDTGAAVKPFSFELDII